MRLGILGGSFNPVHRGHLSLAKFAFSELNLDRLYFVPSCQPPLKSAKDLLPAALRLRLLEKATKLYPQFHVSDCEIRRGGKSYIVDTLKYFRQKYGKSERIYFITGMDALENIARWKSPEKIFKLCRFVAATRPGHSARKTEYPVTILPFEALEISSSEIRKRLKAGKSVDGLAPEEILADLKKFKKGELTSKPKKRLS